MPLKIKDLDEPYTEVSKIEDREPILEKLKGNIDFGDVILKNFINLTENEMRMVLEWRNNASVRKWMYQDHNISLEEHCDFTGKLKQSINNYYWVVKNKHGEYFGTIYFNKINFKNKNAYIGIYSNPYSNLKNKGHLLMKFLKKLAFEIVNLHTLKLEVVEHNERAINFYKKSGFNEEGKLKDFIFKDGKWHDIIVMGIMKN